MTAPRTTEVRVAPTEEGLERIAGAYLAFASRYNLPDDVRADMYVALDELASNVIRYGTATRLTVILTATADAVQVDIVDDGEAFDPFEAAEPDVTQAIGDRPIGGLGIHLVRSLTTSSYERQGAENHVSCVRRFPPRGASAAGSSPR